MDVLIENPESYEEAEFENGTVVQAREIVGETEKAIALPAFEMDLHDPEWKLWLPKSQIHAEAGETDVFVYVPKWLAEKKDLDLVVQSGDYRRTHPDKRD